MAHLLFRAAWVCRFRMLDGEIPVTHKMTYADVIEIALKDAAENPPPVREMSAEQLKDAIANISKALIGSGIDAYERLMMNETRKAYRAELAAREQVP